ncbi:hypothetical protein ACFQL4_07540 [Halosimplex aquaticum]
MTGAPSDDRTADRDGYDAAASTARSPQSGSTDGSASTVATEQRERAAPDVDAAVARIYGRADEIREQEVETALSKLDARGTSRRRTGRPSNGSPTGSSPG